MAVSVDTDFDVPQLIVEVQNRPPLYDTSILEYHDRNLKKRLWREICRELYSGTVWDGLKPNEQSKIEKEVQNRWNSLRGCFRRDIREKNSSDGGKKKRKYIYFDSLLFLLPFTEGTKDDSSVEEENDDQAVKKEIITEKPLEKRPKMKHIKKKEIDEGNTDIEETNQIWLPSIEVNKSDEKDDDDEAFFRSLLPTMKQFTQDQKLMLRIELMKTILNFKQTHFNLTNAFET
ncbi:hypothetical protein ABMA27_007081 [Loxostege sticticalis]|uniref:MADF domain-containing protein n=1 Tax=Loxostege sticticalis TaxID=481309 RepID=A0ABR3ILH5_LOXSC